MSSYADLRTSIPSLRRIGTWATWWWAATCGYALVLIVYSFKNYAADGVSVKAWWHAVRGTFIDSAFLRGVLLTLVLGWVLGGLLWIYFLRRHNVKLAAALTDLFLRIRK